MGEFDAGDGRRLVTYYSEEDNDEADIEAFMGGVAARIATEASSGWRALSTSVVPTRTVRAGWTDTGDQRTSQYAAVVLYALDGT